jgi:hypothetical protein
MSLNITTLFATGGKTFKVSNASWLLSNHEDLSGGKLKDGLKPIMFNCGNPSINLTGFLYLCKKKFPCLHWHY